MMWWGPGGGWAAWLTMGLFMVAFWALVVFLVMWVVRQFRPAPGNGGDRRSNALPILEERFARGEINKDEFEERRAALLDAR